MVDILEKTSTEFKDAAAQALPQRAVTVQIDADVLDFLQTEGMSLDRHLNDLLRFYMDTSLQKEREASPDSWEPGEMQTPPLIL